MKVSPFTPLFFIDRKSDGIDSEYRQVFATTDIITLEVICVLEDGPVATIRNECTGQRHSYVTFQRWNMNGTVTLYYSQFSLPEGYYSIEVEGYGRCEVFEVTSDESVLEQTTLIQYTMKDNRQRTDAVFLVGQDQIVFDFRVPGGFKDNNWQFSVDSEQYTDEYAATTQLYGVETTQKRFTLGNSEGVPVWFGELLNRLLVCTWVFFDGEQYVRTGSNVPEATQTMEGVNSFVFLQTLQKAEGIDISDNGLHQIFLRRIDGNEDYRILEDSEPRAIVT